MRGYGDPTCVESLSGYMETHQNIQEGGGSTIPKTGEREGGGGEVPPFQGPQSIHC